jgi:hypothetical protein
MKILLATIALGLCAFAGLGLGIATLASSSVTASTGVVSVAPVSAHDVVYTLPQIAAGPDNPGGTYAFVTGP